MLVDLVARMHPRTLIFLGDIFDGWIGWDIDPALQQRWDTWIASLDATLYFMPGNRDRLLSQASLGHAIQFLPDPSIMQIKNTRWLMTHGDKYCTKDVLHQWFIALHQNWLKRLFLALPTWCRQSIKSRVKGQSSSRKQTLSLEDQQVPLEVLEQLHLDYQVDMVLYGHTHAPRYLKTDTIQSITLGDWGAHPSYLWIPDDKPWVLSWGR
jgi:UDP-2,3-diacylglucosamine hydrolase